MTISAEVIQQGSTDAPSLRPGGPPRRERLHRPVGPSPPRQVVAAGEHRRRPRRRRSWRGLPSSGRGGRRRGDPFLGGWRMPAASPGSRLRHARDVRQTAAAALGRDAPRQPRRHQGNRCRSRSRPRLRHRPGVEDTTVHGRSSTRRRAGAPHGGRRGPHPRGAPRQRDAGHPRSAQRDGHGAPRRMSGSSRRRVAGVERHGLGGLRDRRARRAACRRRVRVDHGGGPRPARRHRRRRLALGHTVPIGRSAAPRVRRHDLADRCDAVSVWLVCLPRRLARRARTGRNGRRRASGGIDAIGVDAVRRRVRLRRARGVSGATAAAAAAR